MRRLAGGTLCSLLVALVLAALSPGTASAEITNVHPFDGTDTETLAGEEIRDDEDVHAYVTSPSGGEVCIHPSAPAGVPVSCDDAGTWAKKDVGPFFADFIPLASGRLISGDWMLVANNAGGGPATATSETFSVRPCAECGDADYAKSNDFIQKSAQASLVIAQTCDWLSVANVLYQSRQIYALGEVIYSFSSFGAVGALATVAVGTAAATFVSYATPASFLPKAMAVSLWVLCLPFSNLPHVERTTLPYWLSKWAADPPDPHYTEIEPPDFNGFSTVTGLEVGEDMEQYLTDGDRLRGYAAAGLTAYERYQGARADDSVEFEHAQSRALATDLLGMSKELERVADVLTQVAQQTQIDYPDPADRTMTDDDVATARAFMDRVRTSGFAESEAQQLRDMGLDDEHIDVLRRDLGRDLGDFEGGVAADATFDALADAFREMAPAAEDFARDAAVQAGRTNSPPVPGFSVAPPTGEAPLPVSVTDASDSSDLDPLTIGWDFGDGAIGAGASATHTYLADGVYTITQSVSDGYTTVQSTKTVTVGHVNQAPTASFNATPASGHVPLHVEFDASASSDPDGSVTAYHWVFGDGGEGDGAQVSHDYVDTGSYQVELAVTDDGGLTDVHTATIQVTAGNVAPAPADDTLAAEGAGALDVLANDSDPDNDALRVVATGAPAHGTASCAALGGCLYTPAAGYAGPDSFTYRVADPDGLEATANVSVDVTTAPAPSTLVARADHAATRQGTAVTVHVLANDSGTGLHLTDSTDPAHGTAACDDDGSCVYTPSAGYSGSDGFSYTVANADADQRSADVEIAIAPSTAGYGVKVGGAPAAAGLVEGQGASWGAAVAPAPAGVTDEALAALPLPAVTAELGGAHAVKPSSVRTARGWTAEPVAAGARTLHAKAGSDALLGEVSDAIPRPLPAIGQGTGGDGHVPILVGSKVFAFFHHSSPTQVTCVDRATGSLCPGYPKTLNQATTNIPGPAVVVGTRIYVHLSPMQFATQRTAQALYCWDAAKDRTCGLIVVDRLDRQYAYASAPVLIGGKMYFGGDGGRLYCVDPATNAACAVASLPTGLGPDANEYDSVGHGSRVYLGRLDGLTACIDVTAGGPCSGWALPRQLTGPNLVTHHNSAGTADGVCSIAQGAGQCYTDAAPGSAIPITGWPGTEDYYSVTAEAEIGKRTLMAAHGRGGLGCWDWTTMAPCTGGDYVDGWIDHDTQAESLPMAYGAAYDGSCVVGLGDPGLIFTVDPAGHAPCTSLGAGTEPRTIDLRDQRCDSTVGGATWQDVALADSAPGELAAVTVTVRDAATGALLATKDIAGSKLDLSGIDPKAHPAITVAANAISTSGDPAWADSVPPRIRVAWKADPRQLCFETTTQVECASPLAPIGVTASIDGSPAKDEETLDLVRGACPPELPALPDRSVPEQTTLDAAVTASDPNGGPLKYSLLKAPPGMTIDGATGHLAWTPTEAQGPGSYEVTVKVADPGGLADQGTFTAKATEVNRPPVLAPPADATVGTGKPFAGRAVASDPDAPANRLAYALVGPPPGATIDRASGAIAWPSVPSGAHALRVRVTDDGSPPLSAERAFTVTGDAGGTLGNTQQSSAADLVRACTSRGVVLEDVIPAGNRVKLLGVAEERFKGRRVDIVFAATGKVVARPKVAPDGSFSATAPMPPRRLRNSNRARYQARVGGERSLNLKLMRRMLVTSVRTSAGKFTISGRVIGPLALRAKDREIVLERRVTCTRLITVSRFRPRSSGAFKVTVPVPAGTSAAVYRLRTKVRASTHGSRLSSTFTLPRAIGFR